MGLDLYHLREKNVQRDPEWAANKPVDASFRSNELAGETGEACNEVKKLERTRFGMQGGTRDIQPLREELADVIIAADLLAMTFGIDLSEAVKQKFNATSEKYGMRTIFEE